jgi:hypothetical protein
VPSDCTAGDYGWGEYQTSRFARFYPILPIKRTSCVSSIGENMITDTTVVLNGLNIESWINVAAIATLSQQYYMLIAEQESYCEVWVGKVVNKEAVVCLRYCANIYWGAWEGQRRSSARIDGRQRRVLFLSLFNDAFSAAQIAHWRIGSLLLVMIWGWCLRKRSWRILRQCPTFGSEGLR